MNFQQLRYVRSAIQNGLNLTEVANTLFTSQSGVSKQIKELEAELGVEIFVRRGKRLVGLTKAGEDVAGVIDRLLAEADNLKRLSEHYKQSDKGRLVIATTHNQARYALPRVIARFTRLFPDVEVELRQGTPKYVVQTLLRGVADVGIATETVEDSPELTTYSCYSWEHVVVVPPGHPLTQLPTPTLHDIARYPLVTYNAGFSGRSQIDAAFEAAGIVPEIRLTAMDADVIKTYVGIGMGVGIVAEMAAVADPCDDLVTVRGSNAFFAPKVTKIAVRRGALLRNYSYRLIEMLAPHLDYAVLTGTARRPAADREPPVPRFADRADLHRAEEEPPRLAAQGSGAS
ncbi:LysR substrate-binding domain-containing protein [Sphingobium sufflavum]|uniref:LysR substrate-binding domain-containing protein n=1 Tax=Sphingobium sufflavum TaxID=1129547 RepID=UPI001F3A1154|nr:LysR substrate-binding domain-containing protein [Sphingobium sufflavum]MCE7796684.1 LysR substrate-binding domain-containing protein [Sphingobium sufflavum]